MSDDALSGFVMDRALQRRLLELMREAFPNSIYEFPTEMGDLNGPVFENLSYLAGHGLCEGHLQIGMDGHRSFGGVSITVAGLDFLADDGGLTAVLGVVTVKFHADTIREMLAAKVDASSLPEEKKSAWKKAINSLSSMTLQAASKDLITAGIDHVPGGLSWIEHLIGLAG